MKKYIKMKYYLILFSVILFITTSFSLNREKDKPIEEKKTTTLSFIKTKGTQLVDDKGNEIILKGTNLGNWLVPEGYMFKMEQVSSPRKIDELLYELVGPDSLQVFWNGFLNNYITHEDIKYLKSIGSNHIRLPFNYKMFKQTQYFAVDIAKPTANQAWSYRWTSAVLPSKSLIIISNSPFLCQCEV